MIIGGDNTERSGRGRGEVGKPWSATGTGELKQSALTEIGWGVISPQPIFII